MLFSRKKSRLIDRIHPKIPNYVENFSEFFEGPIISSPNLTTRVVMVGGIRWGYKNCIDKCIHKIIVCLFDCLLYAQNSGEEKGMTGKNMKLLSLQHL